jgi:hypothetical protein
MSIKNRRKGRMNWRIRSAVMCFFAIPFIVEAHDDLAARVANFLAEPLDAWEIQFVTTVPSQGRPDVEEKTGPFGPITIVRLFAEHLHARRQPNAFFVQRKNTQFNLPPGKVAAEQEFLFACGYFQHEYWQLEPSNQLTLFYPSNGFRRAAEGHWVSDTVAKYENLCWEALHLGIAGLRRETLAWQGTRFNGLSIASHRIAGQIENVHSDGTFEIHYTVLDMKGSVLEEHKIRYGKEWVNDSMPSTFTRWSRPSPQKDFTLIRSFQISAFRVRTPTPDPDEFRPGELTNANTLVFLRTNNTTFQRQGNNLIPLTAERNPPQIGALKWAVLLILLYMTGYLGWTAVKKIQKDA